jgi:putative ABC transport system permease protein
VLEEFPLAADLDRAAILPAEAAQTYFDADSGPTTIYTRIEDGAIDETRDIIPATADAENPEEVAVSRPSDALEAEAAADDTLTSLFLGLGAVALLVGGIGIANVMVIAVIERRGEIGLRRALGATQAHIRRQFLTEAIILSALGGAAGVALGIGATYAYATAQGWRVIVPTEAAVGGFVAALAIGAVAGLYPAMRAARLAPTEALRA